MSDNQQKQAVAIENTWMMNTQYKAYNGSEKFTCQEKELFSVLDMWRYGYSNLMNMLSMISEFIVAQALGISKAENSSYWAAYDMTYRGLRIEIKSTAYVHPWNKSRVSNQRTFSIAPSNNAYWDDAPDSSDRSRQSDLYIFCIDTNKSIEAANPLKLDAWRFYVVPTSRIDEYVSHRGNRNQKTMSLGVVRELAKHEVSYEHLRGTVDAVATSIIRSNAQKRFTEGGVIPMPKVLPISEFLESPESLIRNAVLGEPLEIHTGHGQNAVLMDETTWHMLHQALAICQEHPKWASHLTKKKIVISN